MTTGQHNWLGGILLALSAGVLPSLEPRLLWVTVFLVGCILFVYSELKQPIVHEILDPEEAPPT